MGFQIKDMSTINAKRLRLIEMRECLRQVQKLLPENSNRGTEFICSLIKDTKCSEQAQTDAKCFVNASIAPHYTFNGCMTYLNGGRMFDSVKIMQLRQQFIDSLCDHINKEIEKVRP